MSYGRKRRLTITISSSHQIPFDSSVLSQCHSKIGREALSCLVSLQPSTSQKNERMNDAMQTQTSSVFDLITLYKFIKLKHTMTKAKVKDNIYNQSATPDESPKLIKDKLAEFELVLDDVRDKEKKGYLMAKDVGADECNDAHKRHKLMFL